METPYLDPLEWKPPFSMADSSARYNGAGAGPVTENSETRDSHLKEEYFFYSADIY